MVNYLSAIIITSLILSHSFSHADIYKFVDSNGVTHFTNIPKNDNYRKIIKENRKDNASDSRKSFSKPDYDHIIKIKSNKYNVEPDIIKAIITVESGWNSKAISKKGALGLMQLMPSTASDLQIHNPMDPEDNIEGGTRYFKSLLDRFSGNLDFALAAYNAGPSTVEKSGGIPQIRETEKYVRDVISLYKERSENISTKIYKVVYSDGTVLYTNTPSSHNEFRLSNF